MTSIGIVGTENSHAEHYVRLLNVDQRHESVRITGLAGGDSERNRQLAGLGAIDLVVDEPTDLLGNVDAVIVCSRDGRQHRQEAEPFLRAGCGVLVDKPLSCDPADAEALIETAREHKAPLMSSSALRWAPEVDQLRSSESPDVVFVTGRADPDSPYGGLFFYGIHVVELALELVGPGPLSEIDLTQVPDGLLGRAVVGGRTVLLHFADPETRPKNYWGVLAAGSAGSSGAELTLGADYLVPVLDRFLNLLADGVPPLTPEELLVPVQLLAALEAQRPGLA